MTYDSTPNCVPKQAPERVAGIVSRLIQCGAVTMGRISRMIGDFKQFALDDEMSTVEELEQVYGRLLAALPK